MPKRRLLESFFSPLLMLCALSLPALARPDDVAGLLAQHLTESQTGSLRVLAENIRAQAAVRKFYAGRNHHPAWQGAAGAEALEQLTRTIESANLHGLDPTHYHRDALQRALNPRQPVALELLATDAYLTLAAHLLSGRLDPVSVEPDWTAIRRERDLAAHLEEALTLGHIASSLEGLAPGAPAYRRLQQALQTYRQAIGEGGWKPVPAGPALKAGDSGPRVQALRDRLQSSGFIPMEKARSDYFDTELEVAVAAFQRRVGLAADGLVGSGTLRELNQSPEMRAAQIRANLERWRWLPDDLGKRHIRVNIADYRLEAINDGKFEQLHEVIVGRTYRKTPVFSGKISYAVLNPWWETPHNLARLDKLPAFRKDPASADRLGFEILDDSGQRQSAESIDWSQYSPSHFPFRLRQKPGPQNALGQVKLMFPNPHNVYLHDTPSRELFNRSERAFSSGCVRVADALGLTAWVLEQTPGWDRRRIDSVIKGGRETRVDLAVQVPVHILYFTAVVGSDGTLRLINDVYDRDQRLISALNKAPGT